MRLLGEIAVLLNVCKLPILVVGDIYNDLSSDLQGRRRRSGWSGLSRTNNLELNQLADQLELATLLSCNLWTITSTCSYVHFTDVIENA